MKTAYISGHRDVSLEEFQRHYVPQLNAALSNGDDFVVGDYYGVDALAQAYLKSHNAKVTVYHMFASPRNNVGFPVCGGYTCDESRDAAMTKHSHYDIAWVRLGRERSGTAKNIQRRAQVTPEL